jgi:hypothetical protein
VLWDALPFRFYSLYQVANKGQILVRVSAIKYVLMRSNKVFGRQGYQIYLNIVFIILRLYGRCCENTYPLLLIATGQSFLTTSQTYPTMKRRHEYTFYFFIKGVHSMWNLASESFNNTRRIEEYSAVLDRA